MATKKQTQETQQVAVAGPTVVKKISVASVYGKIKVKDIPEDGTLDICRLSGVVNATEHGTSDYGTWSCLVGQCAGVNKETGEMFVGKNAFIPGAMGDALVAAMETALSEDAGAQMKFCVDISVKVSTRDPNKFEYIVKPVIESDVKNEAMLLLAL